MDTDNMIFRSVYVDPDVDQAVLAHAKRLGTTGDAAYRLFLETGLAQLAKGAPLPPAKEWRAIALRTAYVLIRSDEKLRVMAFHMRISKTDLSRRVTRLGMLTLKAALGGSDK